MVMTLKGPGNLQSCEQPRVVWLQLEKLQVGGWVQRARPTGYGEKRRDKEYIRTLNMVQANS